MPRLLPTSLLICILAAPAAPAAPAAAAPPTPARDLNDRVTSLTPDLVAATVGIFLEEKSGGAGSGAIITPEGLVMTAAHVTGGPGKPFNILLSDGRKVTATSLGVDHQTDAALLRITTPGRYPFRPYISEKNYHVGDWVLATGHPGGPVIGRPAPVRLGRITNAGAKSGFTDPIATTASIISGDSGGPLFNLDGEVIGINSNISGSWLANNHVPVPCFLEKWDALMAGDSFGEAPDTNLETLVDDPFASMREEHLQLLQEHSDDPDAARLLARPRLLDPHHMQPDLDRWQPDPDAPLTPFFGLRFDLSAPRARVREVLPASPASRAGLRPGDVLTTFDEEPVSDTPSFAHLVKNLNLTPDSTRGINLTISRSGDNLPLELTPDFRRSRRHYPQPLAAFIGSMLREGEEQDLSEDFQKMRDDFRESLTTPLASTRSVVELRRDDETLALATVVSKEGRLITKASLLGEPDDIASLTVRDGDKDRPVTFIAADEDLDLALLQTKPGKLVPVIWTGREPPTGTLVIAPTPAVIKHGILTQPGRPAPKPGFDHPVTPGATPPWLGITLDPDSEQAVVARIDPGSPADLAGILEGDQLTEIGRDKAEGPDTLLDQLSRRQPGQKLSLTIDRNGDSHSMSPILGSRRSLTNKTSMHAVRVDQALGDLSARGGKLSARRQGFPFCLYHDIRLKPADCGGPLLDVTGAVVGINISRSLRHRSLAIPASEVLHFLQSSLESLKAKTQDE